MIAPASEAHQRHQSACGQCSFCEPRLASNGDDWGFPVDVGQLPLANGSIVFICRPCLVRLLPQAYAETIDLASREDFLIGHHAEAIRQNLFRAVAARWLHENRAVCPCRCQDCEEGEA